MNVRPKILIVDDRIEYIISLEKLFSELDVDCIGATSGNEALKKILENDFALALVDVQMPDMDGYETVRLMRQDKKSEHLTVIFNSAIYSEDYYKIKGIETGAIDFITKPVHPVILIGKVRAHLDLYRRKASLQHDYDRLEEIVHNRTVELRTANEQLKNEIVDRKQAEKEREKLNEELEQKNRELGQIVYISSHDLRSPLVNIQGYSNELQHSVKKIISILDNEEINQDIRNKLSPFVTDIPESIKYIHSSVLKMDSLLNGLLQFSRSGQIKLSIEELDMNKILSTVLSDFEFQINNAGVEISIAELPPCSGDETQINQAFSNLLANALKYLDPGRKGIIKITGHQEGSHSVYCMEDNGIGMAPEYHKKIFEIFHQLDPSARGEGLGLSIVQRIIERNNGGMRLESEHGKGSRFFVELMGLKSRQAV